MDESAIAVDMAIELHGVDEAKRIAGEIDRHVNRVSELLGELGDLDIGAYVTPSVRTSCRSAGTSSPAGGS